MEDQYVKRYPPPFAPTPPEPSLGQRFFCFFTSSGRALRRLWQAYQNPDDSHRIVGVVRALAQLRRQEPHHKIVRLISQLLLFLTWSALRNRDCEAACQWLGELDQDFPHLEERVSLRWELMNLLLESPDLNGYLAQTQAFLADPLVNPEFHPDAVHETIDLTYQISPTQCAAALAGAHSQLAQTPEVRTALASCRCPDAFSSREEADTWVTKINPRILAFSDFLQADALLVAARGAEWRGDWAAMENAAQEAIKLLSHYPAAQYWLIRARLHISEGDPLAGIDFQVTDQVTLPGKRLALLINLHTTPALPNAYIAIPIMSGTLGPIAPMEKRLTLGLLKRALASEQARSRENIAECAEVCQKTADIAGPQPWTEFAQALKEIEIDGQYEAAFQRLEQKEVLQEEESAPLVARLARILGGNPQVPAQAKDWPTTLEAAMYRVFSAPKADFAITPAALSQNLAQAGQNPWFQRFSDLSDVGAILNWALRALEGDTAVGDELLAYQVPVQLQPWARFLLTRVGLLALPPKAVPRFMESVGLYQSAEAWFVEAYWCHYGRRNPLSSRWKPMVNFLLRGVDVIFRNSNLNPSVVLRDDMAEDSWELADALLNYRSKGYNSAITLPTDSPAAAFPYLGSLADGSCVQEILLERSFALARAALHEGPIKRAVEQMQILNQDLISLSALAAAFWRPILLYWQGVATAHAGQDEAGDLLASLIPGPKGPEACVQLALLAIKKGDLPKAENALAGLDDQTRGLAYARALIHTRRGEVEAARSILLACLNQDQDRNGHQPYNLAAQRLLAALEEREGQIEAVVKTHSDILASNPEDAITLARLDRLLLYQYYSGLIMQPSVVPSADLRLHKAVPQVGWSRDYHFLARLFLTSAEEMDTAEFRHELSGYLNEARPAAAPAWWQVVARRLLEVGRSGSALAVLGQKGGGEGPSWFRRTYYILRAWELLTKLGQPNRAPDEDAVRTLAHKLWLKRDKPAGQDDELWSTAELMLKEEGLVHLGGRVIGAIKTTAADLEPLLKDHQDPELTRWWSLLRSAAASKDHPDTLEFWNAPGASWGLNDWPFWRITDLWAPEGTPREQAAEILSQAIQEANPASYWSGVQIDLLAALSNWLQNRDDDYLKFYECILPQLENLPVDPRHLWLAAASIWFWRQDWQTLLERELPPCVEDLWYHPARLLMGMGYARAAAAAKDERQAAPLARQAKELLSPLLTQLENSENRNATG